MASCQPHGSAPAMPMSGATKAATPYARKLDLSSSGYVLISRMAVNDNDMAFE